MVYVDLPSQYTKVFVTVNDTSVDYKPFNIPSRAIVVVDNIKVDIYFQSNRYTVVASFAYTFSST